VWYIRLDAFTYYYYFLNNFMNFITSLLKRKNVSFVALVRDKNRLLTNTSSFSVLHNYVETSGYTIRFTPQQLRVDHMYIKLDAS